MSQRITSSEEILQHFLSASGVTTDSRKISPQSMFFALKGETFDGNQFADQALHLGASFVVVDDPSVVKDQRYLYVTNTLDALQTLAKDYRLAVICHVPLAVIGGSNGKTTTKELMYSVVSEAYNTFATQGNLNNHIGVPLSVLSVRPTHQRAIIEIGANHLGEHQLLCEIAQPDVAIITNCGKDHLEGYGDERGVQASANEIASYIYDHQASLILNADDPLLAELNNGSALLYGDAQYATPDQRYIIKGEIDQEFPFLSVVIEGLTIRTRLFGAFQRYNVMAASALATLWDIDPSTIQRGIEKYQPTQNRTQLVKWKKDHAVLLDAYNANPSSMHAMLRAFDRYEVAPKIAIIGEMAELGEHSPREHSQLVELLADSSFDLVILVGKSFTPFQATYPQFRYFPTTTETKLWLDQQHLSPSFFMVKGSRSVALEKIFNPQDLI